MPGKLKFRHIFVSTSIQRYEVISFPKFGVIFVFLELTSI